MIKQLFSNRLARIHIVVWIVYTVYYSSLLKFFFDIPVSIGFIGQTIFHRIGDILLFYFIVYFFSTKEISFKNIYSFFAVFIVGIIGYILYTYFIEFYVFQYFGLNSTTDVPILSKIIPKSILQASTFIIYALGYSFAQRVILQQIEIGKEKERNAQLEKEKAHAEYTFLRSQVNPHFFFNTLNMIYENVRKVSGAGDAVILLADMMRYSTSKTMQQDEVGLRGELDFIDGFLEIQKRRFKNALLIDYKKEGDVQSQRIVPMVIFTFIENAIKHGMNDDPEFPLIIRMSIIQDRFTFMVHNRKNMKTHDFDRGETGISLEILKKRLKAVYKNGGYSLTIDDLEEEFIVNFIVDFKEVKK
jgi:two-component system, LytTR family, sensor kinase